LTSMALEEQTDIDISPYSVQSISE